MTTAKPDAVRELNYRQRRYAADQRRVDRSRAALHDAVVVAHRDAGMSMREIARRVGLTYGRVAQIVRAAGEDTAH